MSNPESLLVAHYEAMRTEELERIKLRDRYLVWYSSVAAAAVAIYLKDSSWWGLVATIPILSLLTSLLYTHTDITLGANSRFLANSYSKAIEEYREVNSISYPIPNWDGSNEQKEYVKSIVFGLRYFVVSVFLGGSAFVAMALTYIQLNKYPSSFWALSIFAIASTALPLGARVKRWHQKQ